MVLYYIVNSADVATFTPYMDSALGGQPFSVYYSKDGTQAIMRFDDADLPPGYSDPGYDIEGLKAIMDSATWGQQAAPRILPPLQRSELARVEGRRLIDQMFLLIEQKLLTGQVNSNQLDSTLNTYEEFLYLMERGFFGLILFKHSNNPIMGNSVLDQADINNLIAQIGQWEALHPRV